MRQEHAFVPCTFSKFRGKNGDQMAKAEGFILDSATGKAAPNFLFLTGDLIVAYENAYEEAKRRVKGKGEVPCLDIAVDVEDVGMSRKVTVLDVLPSKTPAELS